VVLQSALPDFFIAHSGLGRVGAASKTVSNTRSFRLTQMIGERFRNMPKVTIAKIEGRARGGGSEIALAVDMCFAAIGKAIFGQPEVAIGLVPGGGSTQRLPRLIGRGRALEVLVGCNDLSAELAERYGYINRALPADELTPFVEKLAHRIASFPAHAIAHAKAAVDKGAFSSLAEGLLVEAHESDLSVASEVTQARVKEVLKAGAETYEGELELDFYRDSPDKLQSGNDWAKTKTLPSRANFRTSWQLNASVSLVRPSEFTENSQQTADCARNCTRVPPFVGYESAQIAFHGVAIRFLARPMRLVAA